MNMPIDTNTASDLTNTNTVHADSITPEQANLMLAAPVAKPVKVKAAKAKTPKLVTMPTAPKAPKVRAIEAPSFVNLKVDEVGTLDGWNVRGAITEESIKALAGAMKDQGLLHPITVQTSGSRYVVVAGHRRFAAAQLLKWSTIPCRIVSESEALLVMTLENLSREDLKPVEEIDAYMRLAATGMSAREAGRRCGVSNVLVSSRLSIGAYPALVKSMADDDRPLAIKKAEALAKKATQAKLENMPDEWIADALAEQYDALDKAVEKRQATLAAKAGKTPKVNDGASTDLPPAKSTKAKVDAVDLDDVAQYLELAQDAALNAQAGSVTEAFLEGIVYAMTMMTRGDTAALPYIKINPKLDELL